MIVPIHKFLVLPQFASLAFRYLRCLSETNWKWDRGVNDHCQQSETRWDKLSVQLACFWPDTHTPPCSINLLMTISSFKQQVKIMIPNFANLRQYAHFLTLYLAMNCGLQFLF